MVLTRQQAEAWTLNSHNFILGVIIMIKSDRFLFRLFKISVLSILLLCACSAAFGQDDDKTFAETYKKGYVFDERLSALRKEPDVMGPIRQRLRRGRSLYLLESRRDRKGVLY